MRILVLALLSGIPALVYQVIWTREVALLAGSQIEGISVVLAAFFGGLALGSHRLGARADRVASPLRFYAVLEAGAGVLAAASLLGIRWLAREAPDVSSTALLGLGAAAIVPTTFLLGGTLPALLRAAAPATAKAGDAGRMAGVLVGANTTGAVLGVAAAAYGAPRVGLSATFLAAAGSALGLALVATALAWLEKREPTSASAASRDPVRVPATLLLAAGLAGAATLGFEALAARAAALRLGSSLLAWAWVLGVVLAALALGNAVFARLASRSQAPARTLGWVESGAALGIALSLLGLRALPTTAAAGLSLDGLFEVAIAVGIPVFFMGGAFPLFVRLVIDRMETGETPRGERLGTGFGSLSAANTAGGILGALVVPLALLPRLGLDGALLACVAASALLAGGFLRAGGGRGTSILAAAAPLGLAALFAATPPPGAENVLFVHHGRQATAAVVRVPVRGGRDLYVDGDPEASTAGLARETEALLAAVPLTLHPAPKRLLEVGLGSGITLGTASRFPLEELHCVEISEAVLRAARFFEPDNGGVASGGDPRLHIERGDGRAFLAHAEARYDVVVANTVQPWSVGATGLYSVEYFERIAGALRSNGLAAQWLPVDRIGARDLGAVLRTFYGVFLHGAVYWSGGNILVVGSLDELPAWQPDAEETARLRELGLGHYLALDTLRIAGAATVRFVVGEGRILRDDLPHLEARSARARQGGDEVDPEEEEMLLLEQLAAAGRSARTEGLRLWLESLTLRRGGHDERADRFEELAIARGLFHARRARASRLALRGRHELAADRRGEAKARYEEALAVWPGERDALLGSARLAQQSGDPGAAGEALKRLLGFHPGDAEAWNLLADLLYQSGQADEAGEALERALAADPYFPQALANRGLLAVDVGDGPTAQRMLERLLAVSPYGERPETRALRAAIEGS